MNCNGIINKYKKISSIFAVCMMGVESQIGKGSRFFFRLPKGVSRILLAFLLATASLLTAQARPPRASDKATALAKKDYTSQISMVRIARHWSMLILVAIILTSVINSSDLRGRS